MIYIWSTNDRVGAKLIRWGGKDKSSHFVKHYPHLDLVVESRLDTGVHEISMRDWLAQGNKIVYQLETNLGLSDEQLYRLDKMIIGKQYDKMAILWKAVTTLVRKVWRTATLRPRNQWGNKDHYFCVEIVKTHEIVLWSAGVKDLLDWENVYPEEVYEHFLKYSEVFTPWPK